MTFNLLLLFRAKPSFKINFPSQSTDVNLHSLTYHCVLVDGFCQDEISSVIDFHCVGVFFFMVSSVA